MRLFSDEECNKQKASGYHQEAFEKAILNNKQYKS
jgi:hypothetical protein